MSNNILHILLMILYQCKEFHEEFNSHFFSNHILVNTPFPLSYRAQYIEFLRHLLNDGIKVKVVTSMYLELSVLFQYNLGEFTSEQFEVLDITDGMRRRFQESTPINITPSKSILDNVHNLCTPSRNQSLDISSECKDKNVDKVVFYIVDKFSTYMREINETVKDVTVVLIGYIDIANISFSHYIISATSYDDTCFNVVYNNILCNETTSFINRELQIHNIEENVAKQKLYALLQQISAWDDEYIEPKKVGKIRGLLSKYSSVILLSSIKKFQDTAEIIDEVQHTEWKYIIPPHYQMFLSNYLNNQSNNKFISLPYVLKNEMNKEDICVVVSDTIPDIANMNIQRPFALLMNYNLIQKYNMDGTIQELSLDNYNCEAGLIIFVSNKILLTNNLENVKIFEKATRVIYYETRNTSFLKLPSILEKRIHTLQATSLYFSNRNVIEEMPTDSSKNINFRPKNWVCSDSELEQACFFQWNKESNLVDDPSHQWILPNTEDKFIFNNVDPFERNLKEYREKRRKANTLRRRKFVTSSMNY